MRFFCKKLFPVVALLNGICASASMREHGEALPDDHFNCMSDPWETMMLSFLPVVYELTGLVTCLIERSTPADEDSFLISLTTATLHVRAAILSLVFCPTTASTH